MSPSAVFFDLLLHEGRAVIREPPAAALPADALTVLQHAFAAYRLSVAGPLIDFGPHSAGAAAAVLQHACWFLVERDERLLLWRLCGRPLTGRILLPSG